MVQSVILPV